MEKLQQATLKSESYSKWWKLKLAKRPFVQYPKWLCAQNVVIFASISYLLSIHMDSSALN